MARGDSRFGCAAMMILGIVVGMGGGSAWVLSSLFGADTDPWLEHDAGIAASLLAALAGELHVQQQIDAVATGWREANRSRGADQPPEGPGWPVKDDRAERLKLRFQQHLTAALTAAGPRVAGIAVLDRSDGNRPVVLAGDVDAWSEPQGRGVGPERNVQIDRVNHKGRELIVVSRPVRDAWAGATTDLPWVAVIACDPSVSPTPTPDRAQDERGVLIAALLRALAEEYHVLRRIARVASGMDGADEYERRHGAPDSARQAKALDYVQRLTTLEARYQRCLADARAVADTRCLALLVRDADGSRSEPILTTPSHGRFAVDQRFALSRNGTPTGIGIASGTIARRPVLETRAQCRDRYTNAGALPWTVHVWLNADPRQAPGK